MKVILRFYLLILTLWCLPSIGLAQTTLWRWKAIPVDPIWSNAANWEQNNVTATTPPTTTSEVEINLCTVCPILSTHTAISKLTLNSGAGINLQSFTLSVSGNTQLRYARITSNEGKISATEISEVNACTFNGIFPFSPNELTLEKNGGGSPQWTGGNIFNCPVIINNRSSGIFYMQRWAGDTFNETVVFNNYGYNLSVGVTPGAKYHMKVTLNNIGNANSASIYRGTLYGEFEVNNPSLGYITIAGTFKGTVSLNNQQPGPEVTSMTYGNKIVIGDPWTPQTIFEGSVKVTNTSLRNAGYTPVDIQFNPGTNNTSCIFTPTASLSVGEAGFCRGNLILRNCTFRTTEPTQVNLSVGTTLRTYTSQLIIASGTTFTGPIQATSPNILLNGATFNQEATFTKTGTGANNSVGGNIFKRKVMIINQATGNSPMNLATQTNDVIKQ